MSNPSQRCRVQMPESQGCGGESQIGPQNGASVAATLYSKTPNEAPSPEHTATTRAIALNALARVQDIGVDVAIAEGESAERGWD